MTGPCLCFRNPSRSGRLDRLRNSAAPIIKRGLAACPSSNWPKKHMRHKRGTHGFRRTRYWELAPEGAYHMLARAQALEAAGKHVHSPRDRPALMCRPSRTSRGRRPGHPRMVTRVHSERRPAAPEARDRQCRRANSVAWSTAHLRLSWDRARSQPSSSPRLALVRAGG